MHPLEKIILLMAACQLMQTAYIVWHVHELHGTARVWYLAKMSPLILVTLALVVLVLRIFSILPYVGI